MSLFVKFDCKNWNYKARKEKANNNSQTLGSLGALGELYDEKSFFITKEQWQEFEELSAVLRYEKGMRKNIAEYQAYLQIIKNGDANEQ